MRILYTREAGAEIVSQRRSLCNTKQLSSVKGQNTK